MEALWEFLRAGGPYVKVAEVTLIFLALLVSIYASRRIRSHARAIDQVGRKLDASGEKLKMIAREAIEELESGVEKWKGSMKALIAESMEARSTDLSVEGDAAAETKRAEPQGSSQDAPRDAHKQWWQPIVEMKFDDPEQEQPRLHWKNNTRTRLPWPNTWLTTWCNDSPNGVCGVALSGRTDSLDELWQHLHRSARQIERELPEGSTVDEGRFGIGLLRPNVEFRDDDEKRAWMKLTTNHFVNVLRPRMVRLLDQAR